MPRFTLPLEKTDITKQKECHTMTCINTMQGLDRFTVDLFLSKILMMMTTMTMINLC